MHKVQVLFLRLYCRLVHRIYAQILPEIVIFSVRKLGQKWYQMVKDLQVYLSSRQRFFVSSYCNIIR